MSWKHGLHCKSVKEEKKMFCKADVCKKQERKRLKLYTKSKESNSFIKERQTSEQKRHSKRER